MLLFLPSKEATSNIITVNGVAPPAVKSCTEATVTDVQCHPVGEENEIHSGHQEVLPSGKDDEGTKRLYYSTFKCRRVVTALCSLQLLHWMHTCCLLLCGLQ